jgi:hypothetical protein
LEKTSVLRRSGRVWFVLFAVVVLSGCGVEPAHHRRDFTLAGVRGSAQSVQFAATVSGGNSGVTWAVNGVAGGQDSEAENLN